MNHDLLKILSILSGGKTFRMRGKGGVKKGENLPFPVDDLRGKVLDAAGVSVEEQGKLLRKAIDENKKLLSAKKRQYFSHDGIVKDSREDVDHTARMKAVSEIYDLVGAKSPKSGSSNSGVKVEINLPSWYSPEIINVKKDD